MYKPVPKGSMVEVQGIKCQLPPVGYGVDRITGELEYIGVYKASGTTKKQKWERVLLPDNYNELLEEEAEEQKKRKLVDPKDDWTDERIDKHREEHWRYRRCGFWFLNNGEPTYITGTHWFYLNWCVSNIGYMDYRSTDRLLFYAIAHTDESPVAGGVVFVGRRQCGKTYMANAWMLDRISLYKNKHGAIQSKTGDDAKKVFNRLVNCFVDMPEFFKPTYDTSQGMRPKDQLRFFATNIKGKLAEKLKESKEMRSYIDFGTHKSEHYDGDESMFTYILDEFGKKQLSDILETWNVVRPCIDKEGRWFGKAFVCSTIEDMDEVGESPKKIWGGSNIAEINDNGRTETGLYRVFFGAHETTFFDEYGNSLVQKGLDFHNAERASKKDSKTKSSYIRKNPFIVEEAFRVDGDKCLYDDGLLNDQLDKLSWGKSTTERGDFVWKDGVRDSKVIWHKHQKGRWEICWNFEKEGESNNITKIGNHFKPLNIGKFVAGADTFSHSIVKDNRRSDGVLAVKRKFDATKLNDIYNDAFVCLYKYRAPSTEIQYEDMLMTAVFFGCQILFESNKNGWRDYFVHRGYEGFLMKLKNYPDYGIPGAQKTHQQLAEVTEAYILENSQKVWFKDMLVDWLEFDLNNTTAFDTAMATGYTLIADNKILHSRETSKLRSISDYGFKKQKHKIA